MSPTSIVAYLALFMAAGFLFVFASLLLGRFLRPKSPTAVKRETYECGEPAVGSSYVQFDLRFYVVALLFIIFEVEMAFFFPWATVFGKATQLMDPNLPVVVESKGVVKLSAAARQKFRELGVPEAAVRLPDRVSLSGRGALAEYQQQVREEARQLALTAMVDIGVFFAVLLVGFAYVWYRGDLDWVRAVTEGVRSQELGVRMGEQQPLTTPDS
jgi:NADH-quinone oxidoreductase subunit A